MDKYIVLFVFICLNSIVLADLHINEVMYNPLGVDNNLEFVEIYSDSLINLSEYLIGDLDANDTLHQLASFDSPFSLIVEEGFNYSQFNVSIYSAGKTIGNSLNPIDGVFLYLNNSPLDEVRYDDSCSEGFSLEFFNGSFHCSLYIGGTPGSKNSFTSQDFSHILINEFLPNPAGEDDAAMPDGEFIELYNAGTASLDLAASYFKDLSGHSLYITSTNTLNETIIAPSGYLAVFTNGASGFLGNDGFEEVRFFDSDRNLMDHTSYARSSEELSWSLVDNVWQERLPTPNRKNEEEGVNADSYFEIVAIDDLGSNDEAAFGDIIKAQLNIYKGDTSKQSIKVYVEDDEDRISKITKADLFDKFTNYSLSLPIPLLPNCNNGFGDGTYHVKVAWTSSSLEEDSYPIKVKGTSRDTCGIQYVEATPKKGPLEFNISQMPAVVEVGEPFSVMVEVENNDDQDHFIDLYSYAYRGSKSYSGERQQNMQRVLVRSGQNKEVELTNTIEDADTGNYNLKVRLKRDDQKTEKEITASLSVTETLHDAELLPVAYAAAIPLEEQVATKAELETLLLDYALVYESSALKAKDSIPYFLIIVLTLLVLFLLFKKDISKLF
ncbi:MAG TPA: lamin tail domain-containing protein [Candidatus Nanoarchaeia archaeon]|nr:lamin tail domain-containing protein [Candidatus Nanoarchaeia archaeon]